MKKNIYYLFVLITSLILTCEISIAKNTRPLKQRTPFLIAPMIEAMGLCEQAYTLGINEFSKAMDYCGRNSFDSTELLGKALDKLEPNGPSGNVIVGYTYGVSLLGLYTKKLGTWIIDQNRIKKVINQITHLDRPVVLYLMSDHFDTQNPLAQELAKDDINLMSFQDKKTNKEVYFSRSIIPFTLNTEISIPVNKYRFQALKEILIHVKNMPKKHFLKIKAITLNGETHHLFKKFSQGPAYSAPYFITDYSESSINNFRKWLKSSFNSINELNQAIGFDYSSFDDVSPPSEDINVKKNTPLHQHLDAYSQGIINVNGWLWDSQKKIKALYITLNGQIIGEADRHFNRLDVYSAVKEINTPNVGFSYPLNFSNLTIGSYEIQVVAKDINERYFSLRSSTINIKQGIGEPIKNNVPSHYPYFCANNTNQSCCLNFSTEKLSDLGVRYWVDSFDYLQETYHYNKLSHLWSQFREEQVNNFMDKLAQIAKDTGISRKLLYSHQIISNANSDWNPEILASQKSITGKKKYNIGVNLYGGSQYTPAFQELLADQPSGSIGIPEFHPQMYKDKDSFSKSMLNLYNSDVRFITPYFLSLVPNDFINKTLEHNKFLLSSKNVQYGSNAFYQSIIDFSQK